MRCTTSIMGIGVNSPCNNSVLAAGQYNRYPAVTQCRALECIHGFPRVTGGLLKRAGPVAARFYAYLQSPPARAALKKHGFVVPE